MCVCVRAQLVAELQKNLEVLDRIYPKLKIDLVMVQGTPTPSTRQCPPVRPARAMNASRRAALRTRRHLCDLVAKTVAAACALADAKRAQGVLLLSTRRYHEVPTRQCLRVLGGADGPSAAVGAAGDFSPSLVDQLSLHFQVRAETFASHRTLAPETSPCASCDALSPCASQPVPGDTWRRVACRGRAASVKRSGAGAEELHVHRVPWRPLPVPLPLLRPPARSARACVQTRARPCAAHAHGAARSGSPSLRRARVDHSPTPDHARARFAVMAAHRSPSGNGGLCLCSHDIAALGGVRLITY
jgi:hypothetical protein